ncbi:hypothetical protein ASE16_03560 [Leifsonia sp. Root227]|uniref:hypothetical protein n=1 Tax=Leifsonia sp. Root227 TaxID=1736496 RepID=UPI0006F6D4B2|nr:hypothetical protein [Leifsonia sp. Root227]KRC52138.1 hypothetical protein ASE16_03560 [Leifsonia sp. Root227]
MTTNDEIWVHYEQVAGNWAWRITDGNTFLWGGRDNRTEYDAIREAQDRFIDLFPEHVAPEVRIFRTGLEYAQASILERDSHRRRRARGRR